MPNGYTAAIYDGTNSDPIDYLARCARAFGAFVLQREEPITDTLPELPSELGEDSWYAQRTREAKKRLERVRRMDLAAKTAQFTIARRDWIKAHEEIVAENLARMTAVSGPGADDAARREEQPLAGRSNSFANRMTAFLSAYDLGKLGDPSLRTKDITDDLLRGPDMQAIREALRRAAANHVRADWTFQMQREEMARAHSWPRWLAEWVLS